MIRPSFSRTQTICGYCGKRGLRINIKDCNPNQEHGILSATNYAPASNQIQEVNNTVLRAQADVIFFTNEISRMSKLVSQFEYLRRRANDYICTQRAVLAPIHQLPVEVLTTIFLLSAPEVDICDSKSTTWQIMQVCTRWREIALRTTKLWASIRIHPEAVTSSARSQYLSHAVPSAFRALPFCVRRSMNDPISLSASESTIFAKMVNECSSILSQRLTHLSLPLLALIQLVAILGRSGSSGRDFRMLSSLTIVEEPHQRFLQLVTNTGARFPQLTQLSMTLIDFASTRLDLPMHQITKYIIDTTSVDPSRYREVTTILGRMPNLQDLQLFGGIHSRDLFISDIINLPYLRSLTIQCRTSTLARLAYRLNVPALTKLHLIGCGYFPCSIAAEIITLLHVSTCSLTELVLEEVPSSFALQILEITPTLTKLKLKKLVQNEQVPVVQILRFLTRSEDDDHFPRLHSFSFHDSQPSTKEDILQTIFLIMSRLPASHVNQNFGGPSFEPLLQAAIKFETLMEDKMRVILQQFRVETRGRVFLDISVY